ncbi:MAG: hypothetical protein IPJ74_26850 [Saprospiraceae bacterium]|nr:hypothetical protein [Saprospiraceae bacterium]
MPKNFIAKWQMLTYPDPQKLNAPTQQLHHAAQLVSMVGNSYLPKQADDSHTNLEWLPDRQALPGNCIEESFRLLLQFPDFQLEWQTKNGDIISKFALTDQTKEAGITWMKLILQEKFKVSQAQLKPIAHFEIPHHPVEDGAPFQLITKQLHQELALYRHNAHYILEHFASQYKHASPVRTWPHHFDIGVYIPVTFDEDQNATKSVGIGLAIPDQDIDEHYFYVNHWSKFGNTNSSNLPHLPSGYWHTKGWTGAVLPISALVKINSAEEQARQTEAFLEAGIAASLILISE